MHKNYSYSHKNCVQCQNDRSQHRNKSTAMDMLKSKLYELELAKEEEENKKRSQKNEISWGNQIRSYVMQPYTMVKDHRTKTRYQMLCCSKWKFR